MLDAVSLHSAIKHHYGNTPSDISLTIHPHSTHHSHTHTYKHTHTHTHTTSLITIYSMYVHPLKNAFPPPPPPRTPTHTPHSNVQAHPESDMYRRVRVSSKSFSEKVWQLPEASQFLARAGWVEVSYTCTLYIVM